MKKIFTYLVFAFLAVGCWSCKKSTTTVEKPVVPEVPLSDKKTILTFELKKANNAELSKDVVFTISNDSLSAHLPADVSLSNLIPSFTVEGKSVNVNGAAQTSGASQQNFIVPSAYSVIAEDGSTRKYVVAITVDLPVLNINTQGAAIDSKDTYVNGTLSITGNIRPEFAYEGSMKIRGRGNSTWGMAKKPYKIKLDSKSPLLGMGNDKTWVLLANYADKSMMRNAVAFELSGRLQMAFTPQSRFVQVMLNNEYAGTYQLVEQIEVASHKVNVEEQAKNAKDLPQIQGGYLLEVDGFAFQEPLFINTPKGMPITVHYPDVKDISNEQVQFITGYINDFEQALFADNFDDPTNGYRRYFDVDAFINYYLINEIMGNPDTFWSTYMYKKRDGKLQAGPVWDFDIAANNDDRLGDAVNKLMLDAAHDPKAWINRLMEDPGFRKAVRTRWNEVKATQVNNIPSYVDELYQKLNSSQKQNFTRWNILEIKVYRELVLNHTYQREVNYLRNFLEKRIKWLDGQFQGSRFN